MSDVENVSSGISDLVVVGSSAGGVEALSILVSTLPADFPAPIVLAQHLDPNRSSSLDSILQRRTALSIEVVNTRSLLQRGIIYVVPANRHVVIYDGYVEVQGDHHKRPRPSVDLLLSSAAEVYGERLIAVILTGSGSDGAAGAVEVKNAGGTVIVQDPKTARYPSMPLALPPTLIDFEADIEHIGSLLYDLLIGVNLPPPEEKTEDVLRSILELVSFQASIDFRSYKPSTILRRIGRRMTITRSQSMRNYLDYLKTHPDEVAELVKAFLINVTQFFRDADAFAYLKKEILPQVVARARERDHTLRFWTAGCATGEEAYSLAMLITDLLGPEFSAWNVKIFATDVDEAAITFARRGLYSENLLRDVPADYKERFFERVDHGYRISKLLRQIVIFGQQDLSRSAPFPRIDLVLCRNVLIYFTPELQEYVLNQFAFSLSPSGYLFLGKAETVRPLQTFFELVNKHWKVYRCIGNALPTARRPNLANLNVPRLEGYSSNRLNQNAGKQSVEQDSPSTLELGQLRRFNELLLRFSPIGIIVIDRLYRILTANGAARRLLGLREVTHEQDFLHAIHGIPYSEVRSAIDTVFRDRNTITLPEVELDLASGGNGRFISFSISPMQQDIAAGMPELASISVTDVTEQIQVRRQLEAVQTEQTQLMQELSAANKRLNDVNKDLLDANEELQVANEELMLTHEELQASIEEFETTNEELQATNEELETNNEELQSTNEELETTNDELRARTYELQELTTMLESERMHLAEMVELAPFYIMVLRGPNLLVEAFNPRYARLLNEQEVQGRPLEAVFELFWEARIPLVRLAHEVYQHNVTRTTERMLTPVPEADDESKATYFVYTLVPSHDATGNVSGVIIYAADETAQRAREIEEERQRLKLIFDYSYRMALALFDAETTELIMGSPRYLDTVSCVHASDQNNLLGCKWQDLTFIASGDEAATLWKQARESRAPLRLPEVHAKPATGEQEIVWDYSLTPILDMEKHDTICYMLVSAVDVTEQAQARQEMERLNQLKDEFLSLASHELRTPLTSILGNAELLQRGLRQLSRSETPEPALEQEQHILESMIHQAHRLTRLINEMTDITRIRSEQFELKNRENVNIVGLVRRVVEQQRSTTDHPITLETQQEEVEVTCDEARVEQVLNNLINNAIKYSPADKPVVVDIEPTCTEVIISVRDEGQGIGEQEQAHIFERFYRVRTDKNASIEGLGLGLYIAHEIVTKQDGRMWLESKPGKGSTFYFSLPLSKKK